MSLQGPVVVVAEQCAPGLIEAVSAAGAFPVIEASCERASAAIAAADPAAIILADIHAANDRVLGESLTRTITRRAPMVPVVACATGNAVLPYREALAMPDHSTPSAVAARLSSVLRVRALHASVLRRAEAARSAGHALPSTPANDPIEDATVILAGRGRSYPGLSVALGERTGLIGVLTIEAAARYLKTRDADGLVIGDGFYPHNVDALLTVIAEDSRFRDLPVGVIGQPVGIDARRLPHLVFAYQSDCLVSRILPLVRLHAFEARLRRTLDAFVKEGVIDPVTGLMCEGAFMDELERVMSDASRRSGGLSVARLIFETSVDPRALNDAARLVSKLVRGADFACRDRDASILVAFADTAPRQAQIVAKRLVSVLRNTMLQGGRRRPVAPDVALTAWRSTDTRASLLARITPAAVAAE
ncbi:MAG: GGDEF domain-containing protein [Pseudorhodoplanes sp.]|uniref:GGDEF domain-containing protein n=1 Tax=Pseudorhodoplanes sp. TaxID=1934341 RepID=UPI003D1434DA